MDASLSAQSALICFASCSDEDIATALHNRTDLRGRLRDLIASSFQDPADASQTASASANWPDSRPATPAPHAVFGGKQTSQSNKGAGKQGPASHGKGPADYAPQSRPRLYWHDMSHEPQASNTNWDQTHYTPPRSHAEHDPWRQSSNPRRNAHREPWPTGSPLAQRPDWNAPQAQHSRSPPASEQGGRKTFP